MYLDLLGGNQLTLIYENYLEPCKDHHGESSMYRGATEGGVKILYSLLTLPLASAALQGRDSAKLLLWINRPFISVDTRCICSKLYFK